jgi:hypothetical protein
MKAAVFIAIFLPLFVAAFFVFLQSGEHWKAAENRARSRRAAEHKMNGRLLKLDI